MVCSRTGTKTKDLLKILGKLNRLHEKFGDFWWYSFMLFVALRVGDVINAIVGLWLVPKYVGQEELGAVLPLTQFATSVGAPITVLVTVFTKFLNKFKTQGEDGKVKSMLLWFSGIAVIIILITSAVAIAILPHYFERIRVTSGSLVFLIIAAGLITTIQPVFNNALQGLKKFNAITLNSLLAAPVRLVVMLVAMPFRALSGYMVGQIVPQLMSIGIACLSMRKHVHRDIKAVPFWKTDGKDILRYASLVAIGPLVAAFTAPVTYMVIRQRMTEMDSAAYYMISRFAELATFAGATLAFVMFPLAAEAQTRGKSSLKLLRDMSIGTTIFGLAATAILYLFGRQIFEFIPTCRPYVDYVPDMALMALTLTVGIIWTNYCNHEMACNRFWYLTYGEFFAVLQAAFLVCFTGYTFFKGMLPESLVSWMGSLNISNLHNFLIALLLFNVARVFAAALDITIREVCFKRHR